jgi:hypothetical protein
MTKVPKSQEQSGGSSKGKAQPTFKKSMNFGESFN